jgi:hypothetical protein
MFDLFMALVLVLCGAAMLALSPFALVPWLGCVLAVVGLLCIMLAGRLAYEAK